ncbi:VC0807 family protein [Thioalkalivibrio sp. XN279]|uniref:VC0807 family protein n=1 Tax=Thioalkalivibrio sp. XN279 TaxID=2714953 RepID=UPI00140A36B6|nr:VC0807 family protein [Thioalkalivibrio sp. XN279]NHA15836.1 MFS transporter [Thioalkalivibrio sp. XN279]
MSATAEPRESALLSLGVNIAIPAVILMKLSGEETLGPVGGLLLALAFPLGYGVWDFHRRREWNFISVLGFVSILLTGGIGLLQLDPKWIAVKEAAVPGVIGLAVLFSLYTRYPIVRTFLYNDKIIRVAEVDAALAERGNHPAFERTLVHASWMLAASFFLSSLLNFVLAKLIVRSPAGTTAFNEELGRMTALSYPVIVIPSMAIMIITMWYLFSRIRGLTGMDLEQILKT